MDEFTSFSDMFGIKMPEEKSAVKKQGTNKPKKQKSKATSKKTKDDAKYSLPLVVNTEVGCINLDGEGEITKSEIEAKMPIPMKVIDKNNVFIGIIKTTACKKDEKLSCLLLPDKEKADFNVTDEVVEKVGERKLFAVGEKGILRYPEELASNWNLMVPASSKIGFEGRQQSIDFGEQAEEGAYVTIKELVNAWIKENSWVKEADFIYVFEKRENQNYVTIQLQDSKVSEENKSIKVKLPVNMSFLHDAGNLSVLTSEMCGGKEYVDEKDILSVVNKYFPQIYSKDNTDISYVDTVNTVCVMKKGRKKGCKENETFCINTNVADFFINGNELQYKRRIGKIPYAIVEETFQYFHSVLPTEALVRVLYDSNTKRFSLIKMLDVKQDLTSVSWEDAKENMDITQSVVMEIHSHNTMQAFFSEVDNHDEVLPMLYGVMGKINSRFPQLYVRAGSSGRFKRLEYDEVFEYPAVVNDRYEIICYNEIDMLLKDVQNGKFLLVHGFRMFANGNVIWASEQYYDRPVELVEARKVKSGNL